jgi:hypothetical protein
MIAFFIALVLVVVVAIAFHANIRVQGFGVTVETTYTTHQ